MIVMFIFTAWGSRIFARMVNVPLQHLAPMIAFLAIVGSFAIRNSLLDVGLMLLFGLCAYVLHKLGFESGPVVLGLIMGPFAEQGLVQSILMGRASGSVLRLMFSRPISLVPHRSLSSLGNLADGIPLARKAEDRATGAGTRSCRAA